MKKNYERLKWVLLIILGGILFLLAKSASAAPITINHEKILQQQITGIVTGEDNLPLSGVTVSIKGQNRGTVTNMDGKFSITAFEGDILVFSFLGYKRQEILVGDKTKINIQLQEDINALDAVKINAGYYNTTKRESTGNISRVTSKEIENQPVVSPLEALQGRVAGLEVIEPNGIPGVAPTIRIRGQNSLRNGFDNNGNLPLYIIDGMPVNSAPITSINQFQSVSGIDPLQGINPSNIESIEILKDADATAIYGSRGANGVILITTKGGKFTGDKDVVAARVYSGVSQVSHFVDLLDTREYLALRQQAFANDGVEPTEANAKDLLLWDQNRDTDWQKVLFGNSAPTFNADISYSGGGENTSFSVGASYFKQGTVFPGDDSFEKKTANFSLNRRSQNQKFQLNFSANYGITNSDLFSSDNFVSTALSLPPNAPDPYLEDGSLNWENSTWKNPLAVLEGDSKGNINNLVTNLHLQYKLLDELTLKTNLGYTLLNSREEILLPKEIYDPAWVWVKDQSQHNFISRKSWIAEPQIVYNKDFGKSNFDALIGATFQRNSDSSYGIIATGFANRHLLGNMGAADAVSISNDRNSVYNYEAVFGRLGYNWNQTFYLNLTGRRDGSSRFGPQKRFANFGAVGAAWIFSNTTFVQDHLPFLSFGKIRGSYGTTGNDQIGDYRYLETYQSTPGPGGLYPTQLTNPSFSWETNKKLEGALELGFLQDRINFSVSWYRNRSSNQLVGYNLPSITGFSLVEANLPATVQNKGWEFVFSSLNLQTDRLTWKTSFNLSIPSNKLISFKDIEQSSYANSFRVGKSLNLATLYQFDGIDPETGFFKVVDANGDGHLDFADRIISKELDRKFYGGLSNQFSCGNFSLGFLFEFVKQKGRRFYNTVPGFLENTNRESIRGSEYIQRPTQSIMGYLAFNDANSSEYAIIDASYIRLKTLSLGYKLPQPILDNTSISGIELFLHAQNLFTMTNYDGLDPQSPGTIALPALTSIIGGVQINF